MSILRNAFLSLFLIALFPEGDLAAKTRPTRVYAYRGIVSGPNVQAIDEFFQTYEFTNPNDPFSPLRLVQAQDELRTYTVRVVRRLCWVNPRTRRIEFHGPWRPFRTESFSYKWSDIASVPLNTEADERVNNWVDMEGKYLRLELGYLNENLKRQPSVFLRRGENTPVRIRRAGFRYFGPNINTNLGTFGQYVPRVPSTNTP